MSTTLIVIAVVLVALVALIAVNYFRMKNAKPVANSKRIKVLNNKNFKAATKRGVVLLDFWAPWCGPCKIIAPTLNEIADSQTDFMVAKVNVDHNQQLAQKFKVRNIPTMLILKDGKEAGRIVGVKTKRTIMKEVDAVMAG
ncbi:thioredoxin [Draconibacterium orientale]|uniref:Thioredoxin n=1 Tax=Draconibacterium orientale TaxID=1168034 RepID=A0A1I0FDI0_9BACT|nr:thioredoxin [Draconibacterium orientale]SET56150.1 thioredoxin [Draconibacterium orientale]